MIAMIRIKKFTMELNAAQPLTALGISMLVKTANAYPRIQKRGTGTKIGMVMATLTIQFSGVGPLSPKVTFRTVRIATTMTKTFTMELDAEEQAVMEKSRQAKTAPA